MFICKWWVITCQREASDSSQKSKTFYRLGWITTLVDILDKGRAPTLFSVEQMQNLRMDIDHTPAGEFLTCPTFGLHRYSSSVATSNDPILDVMFLARCGQKPSHSFAVTPTYTCPDCNRRHRKHTYDERCALDGPKEKKKAVPRKPARSSADLRERPRIDSPAPGLTN